MLTPNEAQDRATSLISHARRAGANAADAVYAASGSTDVQVRLGALEDVQRSENEEIGLRVFIGKRSATASSSDLSIDALAALAERAVAMAREAPEDEFAALAPEDPLTLTIVLTFRRKTYARGRRRPKMRRAQCPASRIVKAEAQVLDAA
jgi:PmbA protein